MQSIFIDGCENESSQGVHLWSRLRVSRSRIAKDEIGYQEPYTRLPKQHRY